MARLLSPPAILRKKIPMKKLRMMAIATTLVFGGSLSFVVRAQSTTTTQVPPDAVIAKLYRQNTLVFQAKSRALLDKYFEKGLADLIWKALLRWESSGDSDVEAFDYVLYNFGYGEGTIRNFVVGKPSYEARNAQVNVSYDVVYVPPAVSKRSVHKETIIFLLATGNAGWRIADIKYDCRSGIGLCVDSKTSLFEIYSMDAKATSAEREYWEQKSNLLDAQLRPDVQGYKDYLQAYPNGAYADLARAKIRQLEGVPKRPQAAATVTIGPALLFKGTTSKLTSQDKRLIFDALEFTLSANKKFIVVKGVESCGDASAEAEIVDLNADGTEEVFVRWGNYCLAGNTGTNSVLFVRDTSGQFREVLNVLGAAAVLATRNMGFPDVKIAGPGFCFDVLRWNGTKYEYKCSRDERPGACAAKDIATVCR